MKKINLRLSLLFDSGSREGIVAEYLMAQGAGKKNLIMEALIAFYYGDIVYDSSKSDRNLVYRLICVLELKAAYLRQLYGFAPSPNELVAEKVEPTLEEEVFDQSEDFELPNLFKNSPF